MTLALPGAPFGITYRELWLPPGIKGWTGPLPPSVEGGHELTFTGARHGTTCDGVHFEGSIASNINCGAIHNASAKLWISFRFRLNQLFSAASTVDQMLWGKRIDANDLITVYLDATDGKLYFYKRAGAIDLFHIAAQDGAADITSWEAGRWYHVLASISNVNAARFKVDNGTVVTNADVSAAPNGGDFIIGDFDDPGLGTGFEGVIADMFVGTDDLTAAEETDLYKGIPPADAVNEWLLDEGRGVTAYDRGSGGNNGTLDTNAIWAWGQVQQPVISLDAINDHGQSSAGVDISGDLTLVWVGKMKSTYGFSSSHGSLILLRINGNNFIWLYYRPASDAFRFRVYSAGNYYFDYSGKPNIDDYWIFTLTLTEVGALRGYVQGSLIGVATVVGKLPGGKATAYLGSDNTPAVYDISKPLFVALIEGAFTDKQALAYSRFLDRIFNLGVV